MSDPETKSRAGEDLSPAQEIKSALADFVAGFQSQRTETEQRIQQQEERLTMFERKSLARAARPALSAAALEMAPHEKAFGAYLRNASSSPLRR